MDQQKQPTMFPIPNFLWQSLEAALKHESRRLVKDIAATLKTNEADLWREVNKEVFSAYLVDMTEPTNEQFECVSYEAVGNLFKPCRKPVIYGESVCPAHKGCCLSKPPSNLTRYRVLCYYNEDDSEVVRLYLNTSTNEVTDPTTLEIVGTWDTDEKILTLYEQEK
jgi:hypothetical protein